MTHRWGQLPVGNDLGDELPLPVTGGMVEHLTAQDLAYGDADEPEVGSDLGALCALPTARATCQAQEVSTPEWPQALCPILTCPVSFCRAFPRRHSGWCKSRGSQWSDTRGAAGCLAIGIKETGGHVL